MDIEKEVRQAVVAGVKNTLNAEDLVDNVTREVYLIVEARLFQMEMLALLNADVNKKRGNQ